MDTRSLRGRKGFQFFMPENDTGTPACRSAALFLGLLIIGSHTPHHKVIAAGCAFIIDATRFSSNDTGLHPDAGFAGFFFYFIFLDQIHFYKPLQLTLKNYFCTIYGKIFSKTKLSGSSQKLKVPKVN
jgi:hypothetical protein